MTKEDATKKGLVIWFMGLSGSGKTTLATALQNKLGAKNIRTVVLDGDVLRAGINKDLSYDEDSRAENIRRTAEIARIIAGNDLLVICSLITPRQSDRAIAKHILQEKYVEVFVDCPIEICEQRDVKGLYKKARRGEIKNFTGIDAVFEKPAFPDITLHTGSETVAQSADKLYEKVCALLSLEQG